MAFPLVQARASGRTSGNVTSHPITLPAGIVATELLIVLFSVDGTPTTSVQSGVDWTILGQISDGFSNVAAAVCYKTATGSDSLTLGTSASEQSSHISLRISDGGTPTASSSSGGFSGSSNSNPPSHTPPGGAKDYLWIATRSGDSTTVATAAPANYSNLQTLAAATTQGASSNTAERSLNAAVEDPGTFTSASQKWVCWTIAVPPGASAAPPPRSLAVFLQPYFA